MVSGSLVRIAFAAAFALAAAGCARSDPETAAPALDPVVSRVLMAPLLTDPDLTTVDRRFAVAADPAILDNAIPPDDFAPPTIDAARAEARVLAAAASSDGALAGGNCPACKGTFIDDRARIVASGCRLEVAYAWSLKLPEDLPVYPRAHLREAAGSDAPGCRVRAAGFTAPVVAGEVLAFYRAIAEREGYRLTGAGAAAFTGRRGAQRIAVIVRPGAGGFALFDVIVAG